MTTTSTIGNPRFIDASYSSNLRSAAVSVSSIITSSGGKWNEGDKFSDEQIMHILLVAMINKLVSVCTDKQTLQAEMENAAEAPRQWHGALIEPGPFPPAQVLRHFAEVRKLLDARIARHPANL